MANKFKPISISLSPNVQKDDVALALKLLLQPWKWTGHKSAPGFAGHSIVSGSAIASLENEFRNYLGVKYAFSFNSGRSSLYAILRALNLPKGDNVILQAFTCNAVPNPVLWAGLNPIYIDCGNDFNVDIVKLKVESAKSKVLIVQHTFGLPANMDEIISFAQEKGMIVIEDCAHALGAEFNPIRNSPPTGPSGAQSAGGVSNGVNGRKVGTIGDIAFFSFSRDKVISSVYGGMAVTNNDEVGKKLEQLQKEFGMPSLFWTRQQIMHPVLLWFIVLPLYHFIDLGKIFLVLSQWLHILSKAVSWQEKRGLKPDYFPKALPNALAQMALNQFHKLENFNAHRQKIAEFYYKELVGTKFNLPEKNGNIFLRFAITHPNAHEILYEAWHKENILLGDWYRGPVDPHDTQLTEMKYLSKTCPNAEYLAKRTLNLPTHINISMDDAKRIVNFLKKWS